MRPYIICIIAALAILVIAALASSGAVVSAFMQIGVARGFGVLMTGVPRMALLVLLIVFTIHYATPRLLVRGKYVRYIAILGAMSLVGTAISVVCESWLRIALGAMMVPEVLDTLYIWGYVISNSVLVVMLMGGLSVMELYARWRGQVEYENLLSARCQDNIAMLKSRFDAESLLSNLAEIERDIRQGMECVQRKIERLSDDLSHQLYEMPAIQDLGQEDRDGSALSTITDLIVSSRYRLLRWTALELLVIMVSFGAFFPCFQLNMSHMDSMGMAIALSLLNGAVIVNRFLVFPYFRKTGRLATYLMSISVPVVIVGGMAFLASFRTFCGISGSSTLTIFMAILSSFGTMIALGLFWVGTGAFMCLQHRIRTDRRIAALSANGRQVEYSILQKQLNPHFVFNALNNIDFLAEEDSGEAADMMARLRSLLMYQLMDSRKEYTTIGNELEYLRSYLALEKMRHDIFEFDIRCEGNKDCHVPTLLFMPFVENAVKHSTVIEGRRQIGIEVRECDDTVSFSCRNTFRSPAAAAVSKGGIGIKNTERRLHLLFGPAYSLSQKAEDDIFVSFLLIPKHHEMYHSRR